ncbi:hypothetical protein BDY24DRAFT_252543 [Mrakia frigida]|uniref:uncharacterized protein n=1 Tax=Mrakia frigida TaxID=29902 RepID=UPI003FCC0BEA
MQRSISDDLATPPPSDGPPFALPSLSPSSSSTVFSSSSSPLLDILPPLLSPELDPRTKHQQQNPRRGARKSRTGSERRRDVLEQLSSLNREFVLRIAREIEDWGGRSSHHPLLIKGVTPSDQQLVLLIADYYEGLDSELDWAGVRISKTSPPLAGFECVSLSLSSPSSLSRPLNQAHLLSSSQQTRTPLIPLSEVLLHSTRTRTSNYPPPTSKNSSSSPPTISSSSSKFSNHLPLTSPRRWSTNEPYPNNQYHDSSIFPNKSSMPSNWSSRRGSDSATAAVDPGGYESLTFGSVQRPGPPPPPSTSGRVDLGRREGEGEIETIYGVQERGEPFGGKHHDHLRSRQASASGTTYAPPWPEASFMAPVPVAVAVAVAGSASGPADTSE